MLQERRQWRLNPTIGLASAGIALAGLALLFAPGWAQEASPTAIGAPSAADDTAVRAVPAMVVEAWARGDGEGVAAAFTENVDFIAGDGRHVKGRSNIAPYMQEQFDGWLAGSHVVAEVQDVRFLRDDVALVHTLGGIMIAGETEVQPDWLGIQTWVVIEEEGEWLATAYQNSRVSPEVQAATPAAE